MPKSKEIKQTLQEATPVKEVSRPNVLKPAVDMSHRLPKPAEPEVKPFNIKDYYPVLGVVVGGLVIGGGAYAWFKWKPAVSNVIE